MELPHIGQQCALKSCNKLDFLPIKCDSCALIFCLEHYKYSQHSCADASRKDVQVPVCPICSKPVASKRDQLPDIAVSEHIDKFCRKNEALKQPATEPTNLKRCTFSRCKQKDVIYLECNDCGDKFCIKHRHPDDHQCTRKRNIPSSSLQSKIRSAAGASFLEYFNNKRTTNNSNRNFKQMSKEEKLRQEQEDLMLAQALQESLKNPSRLNSNLSSSRNASDTKNCSVI